MADPVFTLFAELTTNSFTDVTAAVERGSWNQTIVDMFHPPSVGRAMFELANDTGTIGPRVNSYSQPGTAVKLTAVCSGVTYALFYGRMTDIAIKSELGRRTAIIEAVDDWDRLQELKYTTRLFSGTKVQSLWTELMSATGVQSFSVSSSILDAVGYAWYNDAPAPDALFELAQAADYQLFVDGNGTYRLSERGWSRFNAASTMNFDTSSWFYAFDSNLSRETVRNRVRVSGQQRSEISSWRVIAEMSSLTPITLPASSSYGLWPKFFNPMDLSATDVPVSSLVSPVSSTDWYVTVTSDGSGADVTSSVTLAFTAFAASAVATFTNNTGSTAWLNRAQIRGYPLNRAPDLVSQIDVASSQSKHGIRAMTVENRLLQWSDYINTYATAVATTRKDGWNEAQATAINNWPVQFATSDLGTIIAVTDPFSGPVTTWRVRGVRHELEMVNGLQHITTWELDTPGSAAPGLNAWGWGTPNWAPGPLGYAAWGGAFSSNMDSATVDYISAAGDTYHSSGKWYFEATFTNTSGNSRGIGLCSASTDLTAGAFFPVTTQEAGYEGRLGVEYFWTGAAMSNVAYGATYDNGITIGVAWNADTGDVHYYRNGVDQGLASNSVIGNLRIYVTGYNAIAHSTMVVTVNPNISK